MERTPFSWRCSGRIGEGPTARRRPASQKNFFSMSTSYALLGRGPGSEPIHMQDGLTRGESTRQVRQPFPTSVFHRMPPGSEPKVDAVERAPFHRARSMVPRRNLRLQEAVQQVALGLIAI